MPLAESSGPVKGQGPRRSVNLGYAIRHPRIRHLPERRLFEDGRYYHSDGRARFLFEASQLCPNRPASSIHFVLLTGAARRLSGIRRPHLQIGSAQKALPETIYWR